MLLDFATGEFVVMCVQKSLRKRRKDSAQGEERRFLFLKIFPLLQLCPMKSTPLINTVPAPLKVALELQPHPFKRPKIGAFK